MSNSPTVSILMPVYNASAYLSDAVTSVLKQTYTDFELVVVNDGSTDDSLNVLSSFLIDKRIRIINNEKNLGLITTLHKGLSECKGKFIARMDADDICDLQRIERQAQFLNEHHEIDIVGGAIRFFNKIAEPYIFHFPTTHDEIHASILFFCPLAHPAIMFRRSLIDTGLIHFDKNYQHAEDYHLWSKLLPQIRTANLPELVLHYRLHEAQVSSGQSNRQYDLSLQIRKEILDLAKVKWANEELALHESVILEKPTLKPHYLEDLANWFKKIEDSNSQSGYWNSDALNAVLKKNFIKTAFRVACYTAVGNQFSPCVKNYLDQKTIVELNSMSTKGSRLLKKIKQFVVRR